jgi:cell division protein FtsB
VRSAAAPEGNGKARFSTKLVALITLALSLVLVLLVFFSHRGLYQIYRLRQEKSSLGAENHRLAEENARLARTIDRLNHDPEMIQDLIRRELNFVKKNEIIIQLPPRKEDKLFKASLIPDKPPSVAKGSNDQSRHRRKNQ